MRKLLSLLLGVLCAQGALWAQVSASPSRLDADADGYVARARSMASSGNFAGVIDQIGALATSGTRLPEAVARECAWLAASAYWQRGDTVCLRLLDKICGSCPSAMEAPEARAALGDWYFFGHHWARALDEYDATDTDRLSPEVKAKVNYRRALCLIRTGFFRQARTQLSLLKGKKEYAQAYTYYNAYLDYIEGDFNRAYGGFAKVDQSSEGFYPGYYMTQIEYTRRQYRDAISHGRTLLSRRPLPDLAPEIERIVGLSYFKTGEGDVARSYIENYLRFTPENPDADALYALGAIAYDNEEWDEAASFFRRLTHLEDETGQSAWLYLGQCLEHTGDTGAAALAFDRAARMGIDRKVTETAQYNYITALTRGGKVPFSNSASKLEEFAARYPESPYAADVEEYLATAYYNDHDYLKALRAAEAIERPSAKTALVKKKILYELGIESLTNGRADESVRYLQRAAAVRTDDRPLNAQVELWLGDALYALHCWNDALKSYSAFLRSGNTGSNKALAYYNSGYARYKLKDWQKAAGDFASALSSKPSLPGPLADDALLRRADCLYYGRQWTQAETLFTQAIEQGVNDEGLSLYRRAALKGIRGDAKGKIADLTALERQWPQSPWLSKVLLDLAVAYEEAGKADLAAEAYRKRLTVSAGEIDIDELLRMATAMQRAGRWEDLLETTSAIRRAGGLEADETATVDLYEADALHALGRIEEASDIYGRLALTPSSEAGSKASVTLAETDLADGNPARALERMEKFTESGTSHQYWLARAFIALADAHAQLGDKGLAREYLLSLQQNYPGTEPDITNAISTRISKWK